MGDILGVPPGPLDSRGWGPTTEDRHMAFYHRVHEPTGDGWDVICTEHGRIAGGPGDLSLDKLEAFVLAKEHERTCELIAAARLADPDD